MLGEVLAIGGVDGELKLDVGKDWLFDAIKKRQMNPGFGWIPRV